MLDMNLWQPQLFFQDSFICLTESRTQWFTSTPKPPPPPPLKTNQLPSFWVWVTGNTWGMQVMSGKQCEQWDNGATAQLTFALIRASVEFNISAGNAVWMVHGRSREWKRHSGHSDGCVGEGKHFTIWKLNGFLFGRVNWLDVCLSGRTLNHFPGTCTATPHWQVYGSALKCGDTQCMPLRIRFSIFWSVCPQAEDPLPIYASHQNPTMSVSGTGAVSGTSWGGCLSVRNDCGELN